MDPSRVDALRFLRTLDQAAATTEPAHRRTLLTTALGTWGGSPLEGVGSPALTAEWGPLLTERYLFAVEQRIDLDGGLVPDARLIAELTDLVSQHPLRESLWERLVRVLARSGRRAEALSRYAGLRALLADELGVEPGEDLRRLHAELLAADAEPAARTEVPRQLPFDVAGFTGRGPELAELDRLRPAARPASSSSKAPPASARRRWPCTGPTASGTGSPVASCSSTCAGTPRAPPSRRRRRWPASCARSASRPRRGLPQWRNAPACCAAGWRAAAR